MAEGRRKLRPFNSIFVRRYRLTQRRQLLHQIVVGDGAQLEDRDDDQMVHELERAFRDPNPCCGTPTARILLRYSFHLGNYFHRDMISPLPVEILGRITSKFHNSFPEARSALEEEIQLDYKRNTKKAAFDFLLRNGACSSFQTPKFEDLRSLESSLDPTTVGFYECERPENYSLTRRVMIKKLCFQHFFGKKMIDYWYKYIKCIDWYSSANQLGLTVEISTLKATWESDVKEASLALKASWKTIIRQFVKFVGKRKAELNLEGNATKICLSVDTLVCMLLQKWCQDAIVDYVSCLLGSSQNGTFVFVTHVVVNKNRLEFSPSPEEISQTWMSFCDFIIASSERTVYSINAALEVLLRHDANSTQRTYLRADIPLDFLNHHNRLISETFHDDAPALQDTLKSFMQFSALLQDSFDAEVKTIIKEGTTFEVLTEKLSYYQSLLFLIQAELHHTLRVGRRYKVKLNRLKTFLEERVTSIINLILAEFSRKFADSATEICREYAEYADLALTLPQTTAQWIHQRETVHKLIHSTLPSAGEKIQETIHHYIFLCDQMQVSEANVALAREVLLWKRRMHAAQIEHGRILRRKRIELEVDLKSKRETVNANLKTYNDLLASIQRCSDVEVLGQYVEQGRSLLNRLNEAQEQVARINEEELHFGWMLTDYPVLEQIRNRLMPFLDLFEHSYSFLNQQQQWLSSRLGSFDPEIIMKETESFQSNLAQVQDILPDVSDVRILVAQVEMKLRDFHKVLPLIRTLGNPALRERHWEQIWDTVGVRLSSEAASSLQQLLALQLNKYLKKIEVISYAATQEMSLENSLMRMKNQWSSYSLPIESYRGGEGRVLGNVDQLQRLVEDHIIETQVMRRSPYVKPFEKDAREWEQQLNDMQLLLEHCVFIQDRWCRLEPLLTSPDMLSAAPEEARKFFAIDKSWREVLTAIGQSKQIFSLVYAEHISERLTSCIQQIQLLEKNLHNVMECKRQQYPRFFLLAEDELKELLSFSRDPRKFSTSLWRLYEGVHNLEFNDESNDVVCVISPIGERLVLHEPVNYAKCKGQLDKFLNKLETTLKFSLNQMVTDAVTNFNELELESLLQVPSQVAVLAAQVYCTKIIDSGLSSNNLSIFQTAHEWLSKFHETLSSSSNKVHQLTSETIALTSLYYRDLIENIIREKSEVPNGSLTWESSLKFRLNEDRVEIHVSAFAIRYGMEYIGQPPKMIGHNDSKQILPTITSSLKHRLMGILIGVPRMELMEALCHCTGQRLGRFDCSKSTTIEDILRHIRGTIVCGLWLCYNDVHLLPVSVSSYMSALLTQLQSVDAIPSWLDLPDGSQIPDYGVFGFAPSHEAIHAIEPNLKRAINVNLPDIGYVAELLFPRNGQQVSSCVQKFTTTYELQLGNDDRSKLETLKQLSNITKCVPLPNAILSWGSSRIADHQLPHFTDLVHEYFPNAELSDWKTNPLLNHCKTACDSLKLHFSERILWKISHVLDAYNHRIPTLLFGPGRSGKTSLLRIFCATYTKALNQPLAIDHICIGAFTEDALMSNATQSIIPQMIRNAASQKRILILDGQFIDGVQDRLLEALSKEHILCLRSTEQMVLPSNVYFVFEMNTAACHAISPYQIARCRLIFLEKDHVTWNCLVKSWLKTVPLSLAFLEPLFNILIPPILQYNSSLEHHSTGYHAIKAVSHMLPLVSGLIQPCMEAINKSKSALENEIRQYLQGAIVFAVLWTLGVPGYLQDREGFHDFFFDLLEDALDQNHLLPAARIPGHGTVFDYKLIRDPKCVWQLWSEDLRASHSLSRELPTNELFIPTIDSVRAQHLMSVFISSNIPCVIIGANAVGKTATVTNYLRHKLNQSAYEVLIINASKYLRARTAQAIFMGKMERRRKSVYGPSLGKKAVTFFDDIHTDTLNDQQCDRVNMLLKQCIQLGQIFDSEDGRLSNLIDISFMAASELSDKPSDVLSHFAPIILEPLTMEIVTNILNKMMLWHLDARGFGKEFDSSINQLITACLTIYQLIIETKEFARYSWNLRDALRCVHGLLLSVPEAIEDVPAMKRLWVHEALRVFSDRLSENDGVSKVTEYVETVCEQNLKSTVKELLSHLELADPADMANMNTNSIFFCDFSDPKADTRSYTEVIDMEHLHKVVGGYLREYNNMTKRPMHYFNVFRFFIRTMSKATRVLKHPRGHLIIVGPVGVGRHSISRMAGHASDSEVHQFEMVNDWHYKDWIETFKTALVRAATEDKRSLFILSDVEFEYDDCKALINHVVNSGDVMHLFSTDERVDLVEKMRAIDLQKEKSLQTDGSVAALKEMFESRMWEQVRVVIVLRSVTDLAKVYSTCPQLGTSCQTIYAHPWPADTIEDFVLRVFNEIDLEEDQKPELIALIKCIHLTTRSSNDVVYEYGLFLEYLNVTATLTRTYKHELKVRQQICAQAVDKLDEAAKRVTSMEEELEKWRSNLEKLRAPPGASAAADKIKRTEQDIEMLSCSIDRAKDLLSNLSNYCDEWRKATVVLQKRIASCHLDAGLTAAILTCCARLPEIERVTNFQCWKREAEHHGHSFSDLPHYLDLVDSEKQETAAYWTMANLPTDDHCISSGVIIRYVQRVPLLIDPHHIAIKWVTAVAQQKEIKPTFLNMSSPDYLEQLSSCLQLGALVVVDITEIEFDTAIIPLLLRQTFNQGTTNYIKLGPNLVEYAADFQLYLRSQTPVTDERILLCVTVVDFTLDDQGILETLVSALVNNERPDHEERIQLAKQMMDLINELNETELNLLKILSQSDGYWIENDQVITSLLPSVTQSKLLKDKLETLEQTKKRMEIQRQTFGPTAIFAANILSALSPMTKFYGHLHFPIERFANTIVACLEDSDDGDEDFDSSFSSIRKLSGRIYRKLKLGLNRHHRIIAAILVAVCVAQSEGLCDSAFYSQLLRAEINFESQAVDENWNLWLREITENRLAIGTASDQFTRKFLRISQRIEFSECAMAVMDFPNSTPVLMLIERGLNLLTIISRMAKELDFPEDRIKFTAVSGLDVLNWAEIEDSVRRGNWLVFQGFAYLRNMVRNVYTLIEYLNVDYMSPEFRLWIVWGSDDECRPPRILLEHARSLFFEKVHTAEDCYLDVVTSSEFDMFLTMEHEAVEPEIKYTLVALIIVLRISLWDRLNVVVPASENLTMLKSMVQMIQEGIPYREAFQSVVLSSICEGIPDEQQTTFQRDLSDLLEDRNTSWVKAVQLLRDKWSNPTGISCELSMIFDLITLPENESKRHSETASEIWRFLTETFANPLIDMV